MQDHARGTAEPGPTPRGVTWTHPVFAHHPVVTTHECCPHGYWPPPCDSTAALTCDSHLKPGERREGWRRWAIESMAHRCTGPRGCPPTLWYWRVAAATWRAGWPTSARLHAPPRQRDCLAWQATRELGWQGQPMVRRKQQELHGDDSSAGFGRVQGQGLAGLRIERHLSNGARRRTPSRPGPIAAG